MTDDRKLDALLDGVDPLGDHERETARLDAFFSGLGDDEWAAPSRCDGWSVRDVLGHLAGSEEYNHACLDDAIPALFERYAGRGVSDVHSFNAAGVADRRDRPVDEVLAEWRAAVRRTRDGLRARGEGTVPTMVGPYPARWQGAHLAAELATHADDVDVPVTADEAAGRTAWRAAVARFMLAEAKPDIAVEDSGSGRTHVRGGGVDADVDDDAFVAAVNGRADASTADPAVVAAVNTMI